jgi:DNA invertase Pin-like site-specific DNA recombinase
MSEPVQARVSLLIGYARVSTDLQNLDLQLDALADAGSSRVYRDTGSGSLKHRPELDACLDYLRAGDTLVVWRLDRLGRGLKHLIELVEQLQQREVGFRSLTEQIDTTTPAGRLQFPSVRRTGRVRTRDHPRAHPRRSSRGAGGRTGGRPVTLTPEKVAAAEAMRAAGHPIVQIARVLGAHRATLYRHLEREPQT